MYKDLKELFTHHFRHTPIDAKLHQEIKQFRLQWANKNEVHIEFLGGNLLGPYPIRFSQYDFDAIMIDVLGLDSMVLQQDLYTVPGINKEFKVSSDALYQTMIYLIRTFLLEAKFKEKDRIDAAKECYYIFAYRAISSLVYRYFRYPLDKQIALAVTEKMSNRYLIKKLGSWQKVFEYRAEDIVSPRGIHAQRLRRYTVRDAVEIANDLQGRIRDTVKYIFSLTLEVIESGAYVKSQSLTITDVDGNEVVRDMTDNMDKYVSYLWTTVQVPGALIKHELVQLVYATVSSMHSGDLETALRYITSVDDEEVRDRIHHLIEDVISYSIQYLNSKEMTQMDLAHADKILLLLRGFWMSSKVTEARIKEVKSLGDWLAYKAIRRKSRARVNALRVGIFLYLVLRAMYRNYE
jgi:hypothetical protein